MCACGWLEGIYFKKHLHTTITSLSTFLIILPFSPLPKCIQAQDGGSFVPWLQRRDTYLCWLKELSQSTFLKIHIHCPLPNSFTAGKCLYYALSLVSTCMALGNHRTSFQLLASKPGTISTGNPLRCSISTLRSTVQRHLVFSFRSCFQTLGSTLSTSCCFQL